MMKICDIIIPVYNSPDWLELCVEAAVKSDVSKLIKNIIIIDDFSNAETKLCIKNLLDKYAMIKLLENEENLGFVKTCNKGLEHSTADYIMLLNSDCLLAEDTIMKMVNCLVNNDDIGLICPLSNNSANISIDIPDGLNYIKVDKVLEKNFSGLFFDACTIVGNCLIISRNCYEKTGNLDEEYGMGYGEETDYQFKAQIKGFNAVVAVDTYVFHKSQISFGSGIELNERKKKNTELFFSRWGYEYQERMKKYKKNDPVQYVNSNLSEEEIIGINTYVSKYFDRDFIERLNKLDAKYQNTLNGNSNKTKKNKKILPQKLSGLYHAVCNIYRAEGTTSLCRRSFRYLMGRDPFPERNINNINNEMTNNDGRAKFKDLLFVIEYDSFSSRYRVDHAVEQLEFNGIYSDVAHIYDLKRDILKYYRGVVIYRCPYNERLDKFIVEAKSQNKIVFYDVDDLIFDYDKIKNLNFLKNEDYLNFEEYTKNIRRCISKCDYAITTTETLKNELEKIIPNVYVNRNVASEEMVKYSLEAIDEKMDRNNKIIIGYFSGTKTHDKDFELISDAIIKLMNENEYLYLKCVGFIELHEKFNKFNDRIIRNKFVDWRELPKLIADVDINLMPLEDNIFCCAKSENKWIESSLVKTVTILSDIGELSNIIENNVTGFLCKDTNDWYETINMLINNRLKMREIAQNAFEKVYYNHTTAYTGYELASFYRRRLAKSVAFIVPGTGVCGGINVILKHCSILKQSGCDVFVINKCDDLNDCKSGVDNFYVLSSNTNFIGFIDTVVATMWNTIPVIDKMYNYINKYYLVQGFETEFYNQTESSLRRMANTTYSRDDIKYITVSKWCEKWLMNNFYRSPKLVHNGLDSEKFRYIERDYTKKINILIEGDPESINKNTDESFRIVNLLDKDKFKIVFLSYASKPKFWYKVDEFYHMVPYNEVSEIYRKCHILIKSSIFESFSYPPLEMMSTGGLVVAIQNEGNKEYMKDNYNCLIYNKGNIFEAAEKINILINDVKLRNMLIDNGLKTAEMRNWQNFKQEIIDAYC